MASKYARFDSNLFAWLRRLRDRDIGVTTADAIKALGVTDKARQRHISRRFTQLEDRGVLKCTLHGTTRICTVVAEVPGSLAKRHWRSMIHADVRNTLSRKTAPLNQGASAPSIPARNSAEFEAAGGVIERLPSHWDNAPRGSKPLGDSFTFDE